MAATAAKPKPQKNGKRTVKTRPAAPREYPVDGMATVRDACEFLQLGRSKIYELMSDGKLAYAEFGRRRRIAWSTLRSFLK